MESLNEFLVFAILSAATAAAAASDGCGCPMGCSCQQPTDIELIVDCANRTGSIMPVDIDTELNELINCTARQQDAQITSLTISRTDITELPPALCALTNVSNLNIRYNRRLKRFPSNCFCNMTVLSSLTAANNGITELQDGLLDGLANLGTLDLSGNAIERIGLHVFDDPGKLLKLGLINLKYNKLDSVEPWPLKLASTAKRSIILSRNNISTFSNKMGFKFITCSDAGSFFPFDVYLKSNQIAHVMDIFDGWGAERFMDVLCLVRRDKHKHRQLHIGDNPYVCDCVDFDIYRFVASFTHSNFLGSGLYCRGDPGVIHHEYGKLPIDTYVCLVDEDCPAGCKCINRPANASLEVSCSNVASLTELPWRLPRLPKSFSSYRLTLANSGPLHRLEYRDYLNTTLIFEAINCGVEVIDLAVWDQLARMEIVSLSGNLLTALPASFGANVTNDTKRMHLDLSNNPWPCGCDDRQLRDTMVSLKPILEYPHGILCGTPGRLRGKNIFELSDEEFCVDPVKRAITISLSSVLGVVVVAVCCYCLVYGLRMRLFTRFKFHPFDRDECHGEEMDYDVFLCCSSEDHEQFGVQLLRLIDDLGYRVCYHMRDFLGGELIDANICRAVERSKRTLCLLSEHFLQSAFCQREFDMALHHNVTLKKKRRLIVLMMLDNPRSLVDDVDPDKDTLRQYISQYTYIDYKAADWWQQLMYALPLRGMGASDEGGERLSTSDQCFSIDDSPLINASGQAEIASARNHCLL